MKLRWNENIVSLVLAYFTRGDQDLDLLRHSFYSHTHTHTHEHNAQGIDSNLRMFCCTRDKLWSAFSGRNDFNSGAAGMQKKKDEEEPFRPITWRMPRRIVRDSDDWFSNPWEVRLG